MAQERLVFSAVAFKRRIAPKRFAEFFHSLATPTGATDCAFATDRGAPVFLFMKSNERGTLRIVPRKVSSLIAVAKSQFLFQSNRYLSRCFAMISRKSTVRTISYSDFFLSRCNPSKFFVFKQYFILFFDFSVA